MSRRYEIEKISDVEVKVSIYNNEDLEDVIVLKKGMEVYYTQLFYEANQFNILNLKLRTLKDNYFVGVTKIDKTAHLFNYSALNQYVYLDRSVALDITLKAEREFRRNNSYEESDDDFIL